MKRLFTIFGALFLVFVVGGAGFIGYAAYQGNILDASSREYVDRAVPAIVTAWPKAEFLSRASPQLQAVIREDPGRLDLLFRKLSRLGAVKAYGGTQGDSNVSYIAGRGKLTTASYVTKAQFENGTAEITIRLIKTGDVWQLLYFNVHSPLFLQ